MNDLLEIENNPSLFEYKFPKYNFHLWPIVRFYLLQRCIEEKLNVKDPWDVPQKISLFNLIKYLLFSFLYIPLRLISHFPILIFGTDISNILKNGTYFNRLNEHFAMEYDRDTLVIESSDRHSYHRPKKRRTFYFDGIKIIIFILSKFNFVRRKNIRVINDFMAFLKRYFENDFINNKFIWENLLLELCRFVKRLPYLHFFYKLLLLKFKTKIILIENACGGSNLAVLIKVAKENNVRVAEYQHGLLSRTIPYYNFSDSIEDSPYLQYLPDDFLFYGNYWIQQIKLPINKIVIGNPYLTEYAANKAHGGTIKNVILYVSSSSNVQRNIKDVLFLSNYFIESEYRVIFRPHPSEYSAITSIYSDLIKNDVLIYTGDLYTMLSNCKYLVGECSTVIYEAVIFKINIFVLETPLAHNNIDISQFNIVNDMPDFIQKMNYSKMSINIDDLWRSNWKLHYHHYIDNYL
jgi:hypothetical protein